jgi:hypothetical protein
MAAVTRPGAGETLGWAERNDAQASQLLHLVEAASPIQQMGLSALPHIGGDHPKPQGLFVDLLFGPAQFVWPVDSETQLANDADTLAQEEKFHEQMAEEASNDAKDVFNNYWTAGKGAEAAEAAYKQAVKARLAQAEVCKVAKGLVSRVASDVERTKRLMAEESDAAHAEVNAFLRSGSGQSIAQVAAILSKHRLMIQAHSGDLQSHVANDTILFANGFPLTPGVGVQAKEAGNGTTSDASSDAQAPVPSDSPSSSPGTAANGGGIKGDASSGGLGGGDIRPQQVAPSGIASRHSSDAVPRPAPSPSPAVLGSAGGLSGLAGMPSGGGGVPSMSGLQGLLGGFGGFPGAGMAPTAGLGSPVMQTPPASVPSLGMDFGRGLAAGAAAAGGVAPVAPVPQAPVTPLAAPIESAPTSAAPAAAPVSAPPPSPASAPAGPAAGMPSGGLAPYGSVLPPGASAASAAGSVPSAPSMPTETGGGPAAPGPGAGLMPVAGRRDGAAVRRDLAESDLELARLAVAELAGAACVVDAGLDWAVAVGRNPSSSMTTLWVASNDGAAYIPPGVYLRKTMPVAAGLDEDFDARWFGWVNPAEKAVRAARARGEAVGAVATTWAWPSEYLEDPDSAVREVATGVLAAGADSAAAELLPSRSHRLQTVDAALYADLKAADESAVRDYCRELVRRLAFGGTGDELSPVAQSVAHALVAQRWPKAEEWAALGAEYDTALLLMGAQRPGLNGVEDPDQVITYARLFMNCRRLEALLCWHRFGANLANVVYAAWVAGVRMPLSELVLH